MPSFNEYKKMYGGKTQGQVRKEDSDLIIKSTWNEDPNSKVAYFYSQEYDNEFMVSDDLHPEKSKTKIPIDIKFFEIEYNSLAKDEVGQHIEFQPGFNYKDLVPFYDELFGKPLGAKFPDGLYFDIADADGIYHRWLCVDQYRRYANQFPTYIVLPCNFKAQWIYKNKKYESWGVKRNQNSYNNGVWEAYRLTSPENQKLLWLPFNKWTSTIFYDQRMAISQDRDIPVVWSCSKVEDKNVNGITRYTWKQDKWNEHNDYKEYDEDGNLVGIWCDYFKEDIPPEKPNEHTPTTYSVITYSGNNANIRINGSYKKFTVTFYDADGEVNYQPGTWTFTVDDVDASEHIELITAEDDGTLTPNQIKIKFVGDDTYIEKKLVVGYESDSKIKSSVTLNLLGL